jgi:hypothetical protein
VVFVSFSLEKDTKTYKRNRLPEPAFSFKSTLAVSPLKKGFIDEEYM